MLAQANNGGGSALTSLIPLLLIGAFFYWVMIRPQRNRLRQVRETQASVSTGQEVVMTSGLYGTVAELDDETVTLEIAPGVKARFARGAIAQVVTPATSEPAET